MPIFEKLGKIKINQSIKTDREKMCVSFITPCSIQQSLCFTIEEEFVLIEVKPWD